MSTIRSSLPAGVFSTHFTPLAVVARGKLPARGLQHAVLRAQQVLQEVLVALARCRPGCCARRCRCGASSPGLFRVRVADVQRSPTSAARPRVL